MLYQDTQTGMLHQVPDSQVNGWGLAEDPYGEAQMVYDGLGNPLGWGFLKKLVKKAMPFATSMLGPYGQIIKHALPVVTRALAPTAQALRAQAAQQLAPSSQAFQEAAPLEGVAVGFPRPGTFRPGTFQPGAFRPMPFRPPLAAGWRQPQPPQAGPQPRRVFMRCSVWPGNRGPLPVNPAQVPMSMPPLPMPPGPPMAMQPGAARRMMQRRIRGRRR